MTWSRKAVVTVATGAFFLWVTAAGAFAQSATTGAINGRVADSTAADLPGVTVTLTSTALMGPQVQTTGEQGAYRFPSLPPGTYKLEYQLTGFGGLVREGIVVGAGFTATVNVSMSVASLE